MPKITVVLRKAFGGAYIVMGSKELGADFIVMGRPLDEQEDDVFSHDRLESFIARLESECGAKVILENEVEE